MFLKNKSLKLNLTKLLIGLILFSFTGIQYEYSCEAEHSRFFFIKKKPSFKFVYDAPLYCYDEATLSDKGKEEYRVYHENVTRYFYSNLLNKISIFVIILMNVLIVSGLVGVIINKKTKEFKLLLSDYFVQFFLMIIVFVLYTIRPYHETLPTDWRYYVLIYFLLSLALDYFIRRELTKTMQKQKSQATKVKI